MRICLFALLFVGCLSPRKAERQLSNIREKYPDLIKCDTTSRIDTVSNLEYDWIETEGPTQTNEIKMVDTVNIKFEKTSIRVKKVIQKVEIIRYVEDTTKIRLLTNQLSKLNQDYKKTYLKSKNQEQYSKVLAVLLALLILALYFVLKKKK